MRPTLLRLFGMRHGGVKLHDCPRAINRHTESGRPTIDTGGREFENGFQASIASSMRTSVPNTTPLASSSC